MEWVMRLKTKFKKLAENACNLVIASLNSPPKILADSPKTFKAFTPFWPKSFAISCIATLKAAVFPFTCSKSCNCAACALFCKPKDVVTVWISCDKGLNACPNLAVSFTNPFKNTPQVVVTPTTQQSGDFFELANISRTGFQVTFKNGSSAVARSFVWAASGFGKEVT